MVHKTALYSASLQTKQRFPSMLNKPARSCVKLCKSALLASPIGSTLPSHSITLDLVEKL